MNTELSNIDVSESLLKYVIERLNNPSDNTSHSEHVKQVVLANFLYRVIINQVSFMRSQYWYIPWPFNQYKPKADEIEQRINTLLQTVKNNDVKNRIMSKAQIENNADNLPHFSPRSNKEANANLLPQILNYTIDYFFTPAFNQIWFDRLAAVIDKHKPQQREALKNKLKQYSELNEINRIARSNLKSEQKLNALHDTLQEILPSHNNYVVAKNLVDTAIAKILQDQLLREIQEICDDPAKDKPTKLSLIYSKIFPDGNNNASVNYIKNEFLREKAFNVARPFLKALENSIIEELENYNHKSHVEQLQNINHLIGTLKGASKQFTDAITAKKKWLTDQIEITVKQTVNHPQMTIFQKIETINNLLGGQLAELSPELSQIIKEAKEALRRNINQEIVKIFNQEALTAAEKLKQITVISKTLARGSVLHQSFINTVDAYLKILVLNELKQFSPLQGQSSLKQLEMLNELTLQAQRLNILDESVSISIKKSNNPLLWKIACEIDLMNRQSFITESAMILPEDIKRYKLPANLFEHSQQKADAIAKTFIAFILGSQDINEACLKIEQAIVIANHLLNKGALDCFYAIVTALNHGAITRLKTAITGISPQASKLLAEFNVLIDANKNFPALRQYQAKAIQSGVDVVPCTLLFARDLTVAAEAPEKSKETILKVVNQFNHYRQNITSKLANKAGVAFQENRALAENVAYQYSEKLAPKNVQQQTPCILTTLHSLVLPVKLNTTAHKKKEANSEAAIPVMRKSGSIILLETANKILRSSSSGSYMANVMSMAADAINAAENITTPKSPVSLPVEPIERISTDKIPMKSQITLKDEKKSAEATKSKALNILKSLTKAWEGFLGFVSLDMQTKSQNNSHHYVVNIENATTSTQLYSTRLPPKSSYNNYRGNSRYRSRFFSQPNSRSCAATAATVDERSYSLSRTSSLIGVN